MIFQYHAKDNSGISRNGEIEAISQDEAVNKLQDQGLIVISCEIVSNSRKSEKNRMIKFILPTISILIVLIFVFLCFRYDPFILNKLESFFNKEKIVFKKAEAENKIDKQKFEKVYRAAKTLSATTEGGISYLKLSELNQDFLTEISILEDCVTTEKEKEVLGLYKRAYTTYSISEKVWKHIIKYNLDNFAKQYPSQAKKVFDNMKLMIDQFGLVLIPKESSYSGTMYELHTSQLSKIWNIADEYMNKANSIVMGKNPN
ncbi:MAG: hypothetical protein KKC39_01220 [Candidatus Omnitrophica bacterium]|nr:hypothetical protein [Candidatus Omnitrophota bacterium]MCG2707151.1 hypothetical protein [Candidatus Omnitrophota bacterium]